MLQRYLHIKNKTKGKVFDLITLQECEDGGDTMEAPNITAQEWEKLCSEEHVRMKEEAKEEARRNPEQQALYRMMCQLDSPAYVRNAFKQEGNESESSGSDEWIVGQERPAQAAKASKAPRKPQLDALGVSRQPRQEPWKKKGALSTLERERIDQLGKKVMTARARRALNLPRPPPRK